MSEVRKFVIFGLKSVIVHSKSPDQQNLEVFFELTYWNEEVRLWGAGSGAQRLTKNRKKIGTSRWSYGRTTQGSVFGKHEKWA